MLRLLAPAKLNLSLHVVGKRPDGYHELETLFERLDLADELTLAPQPQGMTVTCDDPNLDCGPENLVTQAAALVQETCGVQQGVAIHLIKRIPIASGLGGGSSDAATTLIGLRQLWNVRLSRTQLLELAGRLGSDVPFFLEEAAFAIGRGRGDQCEPLDGDLPTLWHALVVPPVRLSTKDVYAGFDGRRQESRLTPPQFAKPKRKLLLKMFCRDDAVYRAGAESEKLGRGLTEPPPSITMCLHALCNGSLGELAKGCSNDLEPEAIRRCPVITEIQTCLQQSGSLVARISGSGPAVFGLCRSRDHANTVAQQLRQAGSPSWSVHVVKTQHGRLADGDH